MKRLHISYKISALLVMCFAITTAAAEFGAYYTKVDSGEDFEKYSRTGPHADIVIRGFGKNNGRLIFWRGSSYLPYLEIGEKKWFLDELTERSGDGPKQRPDNVNTYSVVRIIESSPKKAVIHWRYLPKFEGVNPHFNVANIQYHRDKIKGAEPKHLVQTTKFVDEYFTITPNGKIVRSFRRGASKYDDWSSPENLMIQELKLTDKGVKVVKTHKPGKASPARPVKGNKVQAKTVTNPVRWWKFDEGVGDTTRESVDEDDCVISGHRSYWKKGVSGNALAFDGYTSVVTLPATKAPAINDSVTLEGWAAIGAFPWNWTPLIQQGHEESYYLGIGPHGHVRLTIKVNNKTVTLDSKTQLKRKRWYHLAGTFDKATGKMSVFIDGKIVGELIGPKAGIAASKSPVQIGRGKKMRPSNPVRESTFVDAFSFDGLIDEVRIYDKALTPVEIAQSHAEFKISDTLRNNPDLDKRKLPVGRKSGKFGAYYTHLKFYDTWDGQFRFGDHPDVMVEFDKHPTRFSFWRGMCYITMMGNERDQWFSNEFNETWNRSGGRGCQEPMSDKESFSNHAKIIENTPARCVIVWRYPLVDVLHTIANFNPKTGWGDWSDWTYTIYPDGVAAKELRCWTDGSSPHEWHEGMVITGPDQHPEQVVEVDPALELVTLEGEVRKYSWVNGPPKRTRYRNVNIHVVNFKGEYDPYAIADIRGGGVYGGELTKYSLFPSWNHWPVAQMPSDGRYAQFPDRTAHSSLTHIIPTRHVRPDGNTDKPYEVAYMLEGMSNKKSTELIPLAKSWLHAPAIKEINGCKTFGYNKAKREYPLLATSKTMKVSIEASENQPIENLCFAIRNWGGNGKARVKVEGVKPSDIRQGTFIDTDGTDTMVIWLEMKSEKPTIFTISGAAPADDPKK